MPERESYTSGTPSWVDLQTTDQAAAKQFYGQLFGWSFEDLAVDDGNGVFYTMAKLRGLEVAAIAPLGDQAAQGVPPHWNSYVTVDDIEGTTAKVEPAGGTVLAPPFDVMDAGRMAVIQDPTGAVLELWKAKNSIGARLVNEPNTFCWSELITPDVPTAVAFYEAVLGWGAEAKGDPPYTEFTLGGESIAGGMNPPMPGIPPMWGVYFATDDADAIAAKATSIGGSVIAGPMDIEPGRLVVIADPQGAVFSVLKLKDA
jgi:predicted enzyme related to lactoylglutathione lyase